MTSAAACALLSVGSREQTQRPREVKTETQPIPVDIIVEEEIKEELEALTARLRDIDDRAFDLVGERDKLDKRLAKAMKPKSEDLAKLESLNERVLSTINAGTNLSQRIATLRSPSEHERRVNDKLANIESLRRLRMATEAPAKVTPKDQGFPAEYLNEDGSAFRIGMDARAKSDLVSSALGLITKENPGNSLHVFTEKEATTLLEKRGWTPFLARKREIEEAKAAKQKAAQEAREVKARETAAEKEKKAAERQAEKEAKAAERKAAQEQKAAEKAAAKAESGKAAEAKASGQATPDPKGGQRRSSGRSKAKA